MRQTVCAPSGEGARAIRAVVVTLGRAARILCCGLILVLLSGAANATPTPTSTPKNQPKPTETPRPFCWFPPTGSKDVATLTFTGTNGSAQSYDLVAPNHNLAVISAGVAPNANGEESLACRLSNIDPVFIHYLSGTTMFSGWLCITPTSLNSNFCNDANPHAGKIDCNGGDALGVDIFADSNIGHCGGSTACQNKCDTYCNGNGRTNYGSHCALPQHKCECRCIDRKAGPSGGDGIARCKMGARISIEAGLPCGTGEVFFDFARHCFPMTTSSTTALIKHADFSQSQIGPVDATGAPISCDQISSSLTGLVMDGQVPIVFNPPSSDDVILTLHMPCGPPPQLAPPTNVPSTSEP